MRDTKNYITPDRTVEELYEATLNKRMALLRAGYTVIQTVGVPVGPSDRKRACRSSVSSLVLSRTTLGNPRGLFGGRTGAVALHAEVFKNSKITRKFSRLGRR